MPCRNAGAPGAFGEGGGGGDKVHPDRQPARAAAGAAAGRARSGRGPLAAAAVVPVLVVLGAVVAAGSLAEDIAHLIATYGGNTSGCPDFRPGRRERKGGAWRLRSGNADA